MAERKYKSDFNSRLFTGQLLFMEDGPDYKIDFLEEAVVAEDIKDFFEDRIRELRLLEQRSSRGVCRGLRQQRSESEILERNKEVRAACCRIGDQGMKILLEFLRP